MTSGPQPAWWNRVERGTLGLLLAAVGVLALHKILGYDIWWQIGAGEWIAHHGVPRVDPFSYAYPGQPWIEPRWIWCLLVHGVFDAWGANALIVLKIGLLLAAFGCLFAAGDPRAGWTRAAGVVLALAVAQERFMVRPELVSFLGLTATLLVLRRYRRGGRATLLWLLPLLQVVWCNTHTLWILGPAVQWILILGETVQARAARWLPWAFGGVAPLAASRRRTLAWTALLSSLATLVNPYGIHGMVFPFRLFAELGSGHFLGGIIYEFHSPFSALLFHADPRTIGFLAVVALSLGAFALNRPRWPVGRLALWLAFLVLAARAHRNVALFGFVAGYTTMLNLAEWETARGPVRPARLAVPVTLAAAVYAATIVPLAATDRLYRLQDVAREFGLGVSDRRYPVRALGFLREHDLPTPLIHSLGDGGYVLFEGGPGSVLVDGRLEVYRTAQLREALELTKTGRGLDALVRRTGAGTALVRNDPRDRGLFQALEAAPDWVPVYYDARHVLYLRRTAQTREQAAALAVDWQDPPRFRRARPARVDPPNPLARIPKAADDFEAERLGSLFAAVGNYALAEAYLDSAVRQAPRDPRAAMMLGWIYRGTGRGDEARALLQPLPERFREDPDGHLLAGRIRMARREPEAALDEFQAALDRAGFSARYAEPLARAAIAAGRYALADEVLDRLSADDPNEPDYHNLRGMLALRRQRPDEAREHFERSLALRPDQPRIRSLMPPPTPPQ